MKPTANHRYDVRLGEGFAELTFGLQFDDIVALWGIPTKVWSDEFNTHMTYDDRRVLLWLDEDSRLHWIECHHIDTLLFGENVVGQPANLTVELLKTRLPNDTIDTNDYGRFVSHTWRQNWVEIQVEFGRTTCLNFGCFFDSNDDPIWPEL